MKRSLLSSVAAAAIFFGIAGITPALAQSARVPAVSQISANQRVYSFSERIFPTGNANALVRQQGQSLPVFVLFTPGVSGEGDISGLNTAFTQNIEQATHLSDFIVVVCTYQVPAPACRASDDGSVRGHLPGKAVGPIFLSNNYLSVLSNPNASSTAEFASAVAGGLTQLAQSTGYAANPAAPPAATFTPPPVPNYAAQPQLPPSVTVSHAVPVRHGTPFWVYLLGFGFVLVVLAVIFGRRSGSSTTIINNNATPAPFAPPAPSPWTTPMTAGSSVPPTGTVDPRLLRLRLAAMDQPGYFAHNYSGQSYGRGSVLSNAPQYAQINSSYNTAWGYYQTGNWAGYNATLAVIDGLIAGAAAFCAFEAISELAGFHPEYAMGLGWRPGLAWDDWDYGTYYPGFSDYYDNGYLYGAPTAYETGIVSDPAFVADGGIGYGDVSGVVGDLDGTQVGGVVDDGGQVGGVVDDGGQVGGVVDDGGQVGGAPAGFGDAATASFGDGAQVGGAADDGGQVGGAPGFGSGSPAGFGDGGQVGGAPAPQDDGAQVGGGGFFGGGGFGGGAPVQQDDGDQVGGGFGGGNDTPTDFGGGGFGGGNDTPTDFGGGGFGGGNDTPTDFGGDPNS